MIVASRPSTTASALSIPASARVRSVANGAPIQILAMAPSGSAAPAPVPSPIFPLWDGNKPLLPNPPIHPDSDAMITTIYTNRNGTKLTGPGINDAQSTYYNAVSSDPLVTITCYDRTNPPRVCEDNGKQIYMPADAIGGANIDAHASILQPDGCTLYDFWGFKKPDDAPYLAYYEAPYNVCSGDGFVTSPPRLVRHGGATQGGGSNRLGRATVAELQTGVIHHALEAAVSCNTEEFGVGQSLGYNPPQYSRAEPGHRNTCLNAGPSIPYGAYLWSDIPPANLPPGLDVFTRMICVAMFQYGAVVDTTIGPYNGLSLNTGWNQDDPAYAGWYMATVPGGKTDPTSCFPGGDWKSHIHVVDWTKPSR
jgi:hypothetical protein